MIFVTVGTQLPFDRLVGSIDHWAADHQNHKVIAQIGPSNFRSDNIDCRAFVGADEFRSLVEDCDVLVAHAGIGSILTALDLGKPALVMPRRASLGEHRNEHQRATVQNFSHLSQLTVVEDESELPFALNKILKRGSQEMEKGQGIASSGLLTVVREFLQPQERPSLHVR